jgi:hypothetical protein
VPPLRLHDASNSVRTFVASSPSAVSTRSTSGSPPCCGRSSLVRTQTSALTPGRVSSSWSGSVVRSAQVIPVAEERASALSGQPLSSGSAPEAAAGAGGGAAGWTAAGELPHPETPRTRVAAAIRTAVRTVTPHGGTHGRPSTAEPLILGPGRAVS